MTDNYFGASQFAGGGFMPSPAPAQDNQYGGEGKFRRSGGASRMETIRAVTCHQLTREAKMADEDLYMLDGAPLANVTLVARIVDVQENATRTVYRVDDGTGTLSLFKHTDDDMSSSKHRDLMPNTYVRVYGTLRLKSSSSQAMPGQPQPPEMQAYGIRAITDFNEITYHNLQVIFQHLHLTKGAPPSAQAMGQQPTMAYGAPQQGFGNQPQGMGGYGGIGNMQQPVAGMGGGAPQRTGDPVQDVLQVYNDPANRPRPHGLSYTEVEQQLRARGIHYTLPQIKDHVQFLCNEGLIYSTIDEQHYKSAEA